MPDDPKAAAIQIPFNFDRFLTIGRCETPPPPEKSPQRTSTSATRVGATAIDSEKAMTKTSLTVCPYFVRRPARTRLGPSLTFRP